MGFFAGFAQANPYVLLESSTKSEKDVVEITISSDYSTTKALSKNKTARLNTYEVQKH